MALRIILVGLMMGAAEVVPGVSGGTIAFVSGFYDRLVHAIQRLTPLRLLDLRTVGLKQLWQELDINFLLLLFGSMLVAIVLLARGVSHLLEFYPILIWSFFFGLVLASVYSVVKKLPALNPQMGFAVGVGIAFGLVVTRLVPLDVEPTALILFAGGCIAVCAWILPGLSGSFILLVLGLYQTVILAVRDFEWQTLIYVALGCAVGLVSFSRLLSMLLDRFRSLTISVLLGFMMGSLTKIWPWKRTTSYQIKDDGSQVPVVQEPILPDAYHQITGLEPYLAGALIACVLGVVTILLLEKFAFLVESDRDDT